MSFQFSKIRNQSFGQALLFVLPVAFLTWSCGEREVGLSSALFAPQFRLTGTAAGTSGGLKANCSLDLMFELREQGKSGNVVEYKGTHGGLVQRSVLDSNGNGFSFFIDVHGDAQATIFPTGTGRIEIPVNARSKSRFYRELSSFTAAMDDQGRGSGRWKCSPLDIDTGGYIDNSAIVTGDFQIEPMQSK